MEKEYNKDYLLKHLLEALERSTEEDYRLRQIEIDLLQRLLIADQKISALIKQLAEKTFPKTGKL